MDDFSRKNRPSVRNSRKATPRIRDAQRTSGAERQCPQRAAQPSRSERSAAAASVAAAPAAAGAAPARVLGSLPPFASYAIAAIVVLAAVILVVALAVPNCSGEEAPEVQPATVSFVAVGDNLPDEFIGYYADKLAGQEDDGDYDYAPIYEPLRPYIQQADLAYIDQETHLGGDDIGPKGYPSFNTTDQMADAVVDLGFDFVASATNHSYDWGAFGAVDHSLAVWEKQPVAFTGTAVTEEQYNRIATVEREGITFALLNYTYGVNGYEKSELPAYAVNFIDEQRITADVARAKEQADVVLVAMHWGTENLTEADDEQKRLAQFLADLDVDVVLGSHPHVIGPMEWVANSNGSGHRTLVAYSLGNFLADHESPNDVNVLEGMLTCDFVKELVDPADDGEEGDQAPAYEVTVQNVEWVPLVCHSNADRTEFSVYAVKDYPEDLAKKNRVFTKTADPIAWLNDTTAEIVGSEWLASED